jgi:hypothetical protein
MFYDRFPADLLLTAAQLNGINQTQYIVRNPSFFPEIPDPASLPGLARTVHQVDSQLRAPRVLQSAIGIERQLPRNMSLAVNYAYTRGVHQLRTRDIKFEPCGSERNIGLFSGYGQSGLAPGWPWILQDRSLVR